MDGREGFLECRQPIRIEQTDLWRVEARNGVPESRGVYELVHRDGAWTLDRVWD